MWLSIKEILLSIKNENYVFLRNGMTISDDFEENEDWDILCENKEALTRLCKATSINNSDYNYYTIVNNKRLLIDIRVIGDGYYDAQWEKDILKSRIMKYGYYVMDDENYNYCILYHALLQKADESSLKYKRFIVEKFGCYDIKVNLKQLADYMAKKRYSYTKPLDFGVYNNKKNIDFFMGVLLNG